MASLTITNTFVAGTLAKAAEVNTNFVDVVNWSDGNIQDDNLGQFSGPIVWNIPTAQLAINVTNSGSEGSIKLTQSAALAIGKSSIKISHSVNETVGDAGLFIDFQGASSTIPLVKLNHAGTVGTYFHLTEAGSDLWKLVNATGQIEYQSFGTDRHAFKIAGTEILEIGQSTDTASGNPILAKDTTTPTHLLIKDGLIIGSTTGARLTSPAGSRLRIDNEIELAGGSVLSSNGTELRTNGNISINGGALELVNATGTTLTREGDGTININPRLRIQSGGPLLENSGGKLIVNGQLIQTGASSTRIIRGTLSVGMGGFLGTELVSLSVLNGSGFSVSILNTLSREFQISFSSSYPNADYVVIANPRSNTSFRGSCHATGTSSSSVNMVLTDDNSSGLSGVDRVYFIIMGDT